MPADAHADTHARRHADDEAASRPGGVGMGRGRAGRPAAPQS
ncbi:hypothetical protein ACU686_36130 [Yinghuangia aomiensis]